MKLLFLSYCDYLGAGAASFNRVSNLRKNGIDAKLVVLKKTVSEDFVIGVYDCTTSGGGEKIEKFWKKRDKLKRHIYGWPVSKYCYFDIQIGSVSARKVLNLYGDVPDIICVGWVTDFLSSYTVRRLKSITKAKVIYSMVDNAPITGGCHYPWNCEGYKHNCYPCPALRWHFHLSKFSLSIKRRNITNDMIITGTTNDCNRARESMLFRNCKVVPTVNITTNPYTFSRNVGREKWNIKKDTFVIFVGASFLSEERKGFSYFLDALKILETKGSFVKEIVILIAGDGDIDLPSLYKVIKAGTLGLEDLFKAFCCADIFVCPSVEDSGPMMINYAFGANIPVVCFKMGVALDLIKHKENGYVADLFDANDLAEGIFYWYSRQIDNNVISIINSNIKDNIRLYKNFNSLLGIV